MSNSPTPPPQSLLNHPDLTNRLFSIFNMTSTDFFSTENILPRVSIGYIICLYTAAFPILFVLRKRLLRKIRKLTASSEKKSHQLIFRSLTLQMVMPLSFSCGFVIWFIDFLDIYRLPALQRTVMPISSAFALFSPLIILYYLPPYRKFLLNLFSFSPVGTITEVLPSSESDGRRVKFSQ